MLVYIDRSAPPILGLVMCTCHGSKLQSSWKSCLVSSLMLVGGFKHFLFSTIHGMSSFPLTNSYFIFFKMGTLHHQAVCIVLISVCIDILYCIPPSSFFTFFKMVICPSCPGVFMDNSNVMNSPLQEVVTIPHGMIIRNLRVETTKIHKGFQSGLPSGKLT